MCCPGITGAAALPRSGTAGAGLGFAPVAQRRGKSKSLYLVLKVLFGIAKLISARPHLVQLDEHMGMGTWGGSKPKTKTAFFFFLQFPCDCIQEQGPDVNRAGLKGRAREQLVQKKPVQVLHPEPIPADFPSASVQTG